jgi:hypothetical protein
MNAELNRRAALIIVSLQKFCRDADISTVTAWRMRKRGWLETTNIAGRQYVTDEQSDRFKQRAMAGEFAKVHRVPSVKSSS